MLSGPDRPSAFWLRVLGTIYARETSGLRLEPRYNGTEVCRSTLGGSELCASLGAAAVVVWRAPVFGHPIPLCT